LIRGIGGGIFLIGVFVMLYNLYKTMRNAGSGFVATDLREER